MWSFIAVLVAIVAIFTSIVLYGKQRRRKALSYQIITQTPLLTVKEEIGKDVQILYKEKLVQQVHLIEVKIINSGNIPIEEDHYERPIGLNFGEEAQILTAEVVETNPDSLHASIDVQGGKVVLVPTLLNQGDSVKIKTLISKFGNQIAVDGRIIGVKNIREVTEGLVKFYMTAILGMGLTFIGLAGYLIIAPSQPFFHESNWFFSGLFIAGYGLFISSVFFSPKFRRIFKQILQIKT